MILPFSKIGDPLFPLGENANSGCKRWRQKMVGNNMRNPEMWLFPGRRCDFCIFHCLQDPELIVSLQDLYHFRDSKGGGLRSFWEAFGMDLGSIWGQFWVPGGGFLIKPCFLENRRFTIGKTVIFKVRASPKSTILL